MKKRILLVALTGVMSFSALSQVHIDGIGNVGIGTNIPTDKLDVDGKLRVRDVTMDNTKDSILVVSGDGTVYYRDAASLSGTSTYSVGDFAQGGIVFWIDESGKHGLACAKTDQSSGMRWYAGASTNTMAYGDGPFSGETNTAINIANQGFGDGLPYAARLCNELQITEGGYSYGDWYVPSKYELDLMYINRVAINATAVANGGTAFANNYYWSSTEFSSGHSWEQLFLNGSQFVSLKSNPDYVRAIRAF